MRNLKRAAAALTAAVLAVLATGCASDGDTDTAAGTAASSIVTAATSKAAASPRTATASPTAGRATSKLPTLPPDDEPLAADPSDTTTPEAQRFERLLRATAPELYEGTFSSAHLLVGYGWITCEARRDGDSIDEAAAGITGRSLTSAQARAIVASAGIALCPQVT